jgi:hypothetical protein
MPLAVFSTGIAEFPQPVSLVLSSIKAVEEFGKYSPAPAWTLKSYASTLSDFVNSL